MRIPVAASLMLAVLTTLPASAEIDPSQADEAVRVFLARERISAAHVTVLHGDRVLLQRGYGVAGRSGRAPDATSMFPVGSISKQFTAAAVLELVRAGKLRLDAPVAEYLPEWFAGDRDLLVEHLLWQSSGLADFLWLDGYRALGDAAATPIAAYLSLATAAPRRYPPGARWSYSNTNYKALALIVERASGQSFDRALETLVLGPNGLDGGIVPCHSLLPDGFVPGFSREGTPAPLDASAAAYTGDGGLCATAAALQKWLRIALADRDGPFDGLATPARLADGQRVPYGLGLSTREFLGETALWHGGNVDGHSSMLAYLPGRDLGLVMLTNRGFVWLTELMAAVIGSQPPPVMPQTGSAAAGRYEDGLFQYVVTHDGDALMVDIDLIGRLRFVRAGSREYVAADLPATFRLRMPPDGSTDTFEMDWGEFRSYARRAAP